MSTEIAESIRRAMRRVTASGGAGVHYHVDFAGRAFACHSSRCDSSGLTLREARLTETGARRRVR